MRVNTPYGPMTLMADISEHQGAYPRNSKRYPDLGAYKAAGFQHLSHRVFSGYREDYAAEVNLLAAKQLGLETMWYVWISPQNPIGTALTSLKTTLDKFVRLVGAPPLGIMLDVEDTGTTPPAAEYANYVTQVEALCRRYARTSFYTAGWYWSNRLRGVSQFANWPIITASYPFQSNTGQPLKPWPANLSDLGTWVFTSGDRGQSAVPAEWQGRRWDGWQFTSTLQVPGFVGGIDMNLIRDFAPFRSGTPLPAPGPVPPIPGPAPPPTPIPGPVPPEDDIMQKLIAYRDAPGDIFIASDWNASAGTCLVVAPADDPTIQAYRGLTGPYPAPADDNPWGVQLVDAEAKARHIRLPLVPGAGFYSDLTGAKGPKGDTGATGATGATGSIGPKGDKGDKGDAGAGLTDARVRAIIAGAISNDGV